MSDYEMIADLAMHSNFYALHAMTPEDFASDPVRVMVRILTLINKQCQMQGEIDRMKAALGKADKIIEAAERYDADSVPGKTDMRRREIAEFSNTLSEKGISELYGLIRGPEESEEQLRERLRIYLLEYPRYEVETTTYRRLTDADGSRLIPMDYKWKISVQQANPGIQLLCSKLDPIAVLGTGETLKAHFPEGIESLRKKLIEAGIPVKYADFGNYHPPIWITQQQIEQLGLQ